MPTADPRTGMPGSALRVMALMGLFLVLVHVNRAGGGVLATWFTGRHGYDPVEVASIVGALFFASAIVQIPFGLVFDRFGVRRVTSVMSTLAIVGMLLFAWSGEVWSQFVGRFLIGVGHGGVVAGVYLLAVTWVPPDRVATVAATVMASAGALGMIVATTPLALGLEAFGLEWTFTALAALTLVVTGAVFLFVRDRPEGEAENTRPETFAESLRGLWEVMTHRKLWPLFAMGACFAAPFMTVGGLWAGPYLRDVHGLDGTSVSYVLLAMMVGINAGTFTYGPLDRVFNTRKWVVLGGVSVSTTMLVLLGAWPAMPLPAAVTVLFVFAFCSPFFATLAAHSRGFVPIARAGRTIACVNLCGLTTVFVLQAITGALAEGFTVDGVGSADGYRTIFLTVATTLVAAGLAYSRVEDVRPRPG